jgi:adenosylcobinamide-phosphate synthase
MAGALGLRLAGPRSYAGDLVADAWMGKGRATATPADIRQALRLLARATLLTAAALALALLAAHL